MNKQAIMILAAVLFGQLLISDVLCQLPLRVEKTQAPVAAPLQVRSNQQAVEYRFPAELLKYFEGNWNGAGKFTKSGKDFASDYSFTADRENQCLIVRQKERAPNDFQFLALWSFDPANGNLVILFAGDSGAQLFRSQSRNWENNKIVFQSIAELKDTFAFERFTFERKSDHSFLATYEMSRDGTNWRTGDTQIFTRK